MVVAKHAGMDEFREKVHAGGGHVLAAFPQGALVLKEASGPLDREYGSGGQEWKRVVRPMKRDPSGEEAILIRVGAPRKKWHSGRGSEERAFREVSRDWVVGGGHQVV
jgi:hypothetical protein